MVWSRWQDLAYYGTVSKPGSFRCWKTNWAKIEAKAAEAVEKLQKQLQKETSLRKKAQADAQSEKARRARSKAEVQEKAKSYTEVIAKPQAKTKTKTTTKPRPKEYPLLNRPRNKMRKTLLGA